MASRPTRHHPLEHSKTRVNRAGDALRVWWQGTEDPDLDVLEEHFDVLADFRQAHTYPLQMVAANLRYYVDRCSALGGVAQRLKRLPTILDKLDREPEMDLARMEDIAGCRAIVVNEAEARELLDRLGRSRAWIVRRARDYIAEPKADGYRAIHLVVEKRERRIEMQLRTLEQHRWAELIERVDRKHPHLKLKAGRAPAEVQDYFRLGADIIASRERGAATDPLVAQRFIDLHRRIGGGLV